MPFRSHSSVHWTHLCFHKENKRTKITGGLTPLLCTDNKFSYVFINSNTFSLDVGLEVSVGVMSKKVRTSITHIRTQTHIAIYILLKRNLFILIRHYIKTLNQKRVVCRRGSYLESNIHVPYGVVKHV